VTRHTQRHRTGLPLTLERLTIPLRGAGFALLSATLLVGWVFAEQLYGPRLVGMRPQNDFRARLAHVCPAAG
jgi:ABC-type uncharacterized transport system permease subunit